MIDAPTIQSLYRYNTWANSRVFDAVSGLDQEAFTRDLGSSYPSVRDTLVHLVSAEWIWLERWKGISPRAMLRADDFPNVDAVKDRWSRVEREQRSFVDAVTGGSSLRRYGTSTSRERHGSILSGGRWPTS